MNSSMFTSDTTPCWCPIVRTIDTTGRCPMDGHVNGTRAFLLITDELRLAYAWRGMEPSGVCVVLCMPTLTRLYTRRLIGQRRTVGFQLASMCPTSGHTDKVKHHMACLHCDANVPRGPNISPYNHSRAASKASADSLSLTLANSTSFKLGGRPVRLSGSGLTSARAMRYCMHSKPAFWCFNTVS